jgi:hypothetical protein
MRRREDCAYVRAVSGGFAILTDRPVFQGEQVHFGPIGLLRRPAPSACSVGLLRCGLDCLQIFISYGRKCNAELLAYALTRRSAQQHSAPSRGIEYSCV